MKRKELASVAAAEVPPMLPPSDDKEETDGGGELSADAAAVANPPEFVAEIDVPEVAAVDDDAEG